MKRRTLIKGGLTTLAAYCLPRLSGAAPRSHFQPNWASLTNYQVPGWFRDAKFGMWAHWGPQCQPERGDWYARGMYQEGSDQYQYHCEKYGHPSKAGFKEVIHAWKAELWNPEELVALYKKAGARYFIALANHHDNFDLYNSRYHSWNSTKIGPRKDLVGGWAAAARRQGLHFGVSVHAAHAWSWYETAQRADKTGPMAGVPYDGKLTANDGNGLWWQGLDPQELYAQNHPLSQDSLNDGAINQQWAWGNGVCPPSKEYASQFYKRTIDLIDQYGPDLVYFDDTVLPLWPVSDAGLRIAAHLYNASIKKHGSLQAALFGKILDEQQQKCMIWDIERGQSNKIEDIPWQTDTCIGNWHYDRRIYNNRQYKTAKTIIHTLVDIVSKNGNLLLNIPIRGDGTIDDQERAVVEEIAGWMQLNSEAIYGTRPWRIFGEGPALVAAAPLNGPGFNEGKGRPLGPDDVRFTAKGPKLYAIFMGWPENGRLVIRSINAIPNQNTHLRLLGYGGTIAFSQTAEGLAVTLPAEPPCKHAFVLEITGLT